MDLQTFSSPLDWKFFMKGNANAIYKYGGESKKFTNKVLRVRLKKSQDTYISTIELFEFLERFHTHPVSKFLLKPKIVKVSKGFLDNLEASGSNLMLSENHALLLDDVLYGKFRSYDLSKYCKLHTELTSEYHSTEIYSIILEIKPKWLYDNKSNYCRNCALKQMKKIERHFCSLDLVNVATIKRGADDILSRIPAKAFSESKYMSHSRVQKSLLQYLHTPNNVFSVLKNLQGVCGEKYSISNIKTREEVSEALLIAMAARDVGVFLKFTIPQSTVDGRLPSSGSVHSGVEDLLIEPIVYDFDLKSSSKFEHWNMTELRLQNIYNSYNKKWEFCATRIQEP